MKRSLKNLFEGLNNSDLDRSRGRLMRGNSYRDLSTVCIVPTRGLILAKVVQSWLGLASPMNQKFYRVFIEQMEVGQAYNAGIEMILAHPELSTWKYLLTLEEDNCPPPDGLLRLYESIEKFDAVSGLYWTKGECGQPMIYGNPSVMPRNFIPQPPISDTVQPCNGIGMGFALWKLAMFKTVPKPWFRTLQEFVPGQGMRAATQDLWFCENAGTMGFKFAVDTRIKVGHVSPDGTIW